MTWLQKSVTELVSIFSWLLSYTQVMPNASRSCNCLLSPRLTWVALLQVFFFQGQGATGHTCSRVETLVFHQPIYTQAPENWIPCLIHLSPQRPAQGLATAGPQITFVELNSVYGKECGVAVSSHTRGNGQGHERRCTWLVILLTFNF